MPTSLSIVSTIMSIKPPDCIHAVSNKRNLVPYQPIQIYTKITLNILTFPNTLIL